MHLLLTELATVTKAMAPVIGTAISTTSGTAITASATPTTIKLIKRV